MQPGGGGGVNPQKNEDWSLAHHVVKNVAL